MGILLPCIADAGSFTAAHTTVELVSDQKSIQPGNSIRVALKMTLDDGWHVYWKNPGDSGLPPAIQWDLPDGFKAGAIHWPAPKLISAGPLTSYGYEGVVYLISPIAVPDHVLPTDAVDLKATVEWLACQVDCIPGKAELQLTLPVELNSPQLDKAIAEEFKRTSDTWPVASDAWVITAEDQASEVIFKIIPLNDPRAIREVLFFPDQSNVIDHAAPQIGQTSPEGFELKVVKSNLFPDEVPSIQGILLRPDGWLLSGGTPSLAVNVPLIRQTGHFFPSGGPVTFWTACLFAFVGGIILNLMPCVMPVLSLKILGLVKHTSHRAQMLVHGFLFTAGVLVSFWVLAGILIALKQAGQAIGWGFQFQSSWFVVFIALVLFLCALNLWGVFEVAIDVSPLGTKTHQRGYSGSFWGGVLATIVATPCTAPFMGTAIGFAITQPPWVALLVFSCLALGLSLPYLFLSAFPSLLKWIPKPGPWMVHLKSWLGFVLMGSVVWLIWVLGIQRSVNSMGAFLSGSLCIGLGCWLLGLIQQEGMSWRKALPMTASVILGLVLVIASAAAPYKASQNIAASNVQGIDWKDFSPKKLLKSRSQNKSVFIDFTAAWCLTCQVNDRLVFRNKEVVALFKELDIAALKADWTSHDEAITKALAEYGKNSIPLYVLYPAGSDVPVILPELVTAQHVIQQLRKAIKKD